MNSEFEKYHLIDRFLRGELSHEEQAEFETKLQLDADFALEVEDQKDINEFISAASFHELRQQMTHDIEKREQRSSRRKWVGGVLALLTVITASGYLFFSSNNEPGKETPVELTKNKNIKAPASDSTGKQKTLTQTEPFQAKDTTVIKKKGSSSPKTNLSGSVAKITDSVNAITSSTASMINEAPPEKAGKEEIQDKRKPDTISNNSEAHIIDNKNRISNTPAQESDSVVTKKEKVVDCSEADFNIKWEVEEACKNDNNGKIKVDKSSITGGSKPYTIDLYQGDLKVSKNQYDKLYYGYYTLKVTDADECTDSREIYLGEKQCNQKNTSIAPVYGEKWEYNGIDGETYYLYIYNQAGQVVYKSPLTSGKTNWDGSGNTGSLLRPGVYVFVVEYTNGKRENGQITIIQ